MIFYYAPQTVSLASHITLEDVAADYDEKRLDFSSTEQRSDAYLNVNPKGRVPTLETEQGRITETPAILLFLAQRFPDANLIPVNDPFALAKVQEFNLYLATTVHVAHAHRMRGHRWVDADDQAALQAMQAKVPQTMSECFTLIEQDMFKGPWVMGEAYTICDPYLFTISGWLAGDSVEISRFPAIAAHYARMQEREPVRRVMQAHGLG